MPIAKSGLEEKEKMATLESTLVLVVMKRALRSHLLMHL
jgi:hypothetical protein